MRIILEFSEWIEIREKIKRLCKDISGHQRDVFYDTLDKEFDIVIDRSAYEYTDGRSNNARVGCDKDNEIDTILKRVLRELNKK